MKVKELAKIAMVSGLYVALTLILAPFSFGALQFRVAEMFNHLVIFNKRNIIAVTFGCVIANAFSVLGIIDVFVGGFSTLFMTITIHFATKKIKNLKTKLFVSSLISIPFMLPVALELNYIFKAPLLGTFLVISAGEFISMLVGAVIIYNANKVVDFEK